VSRLLLPLLLLAGLLRPCPVPAQEYQGMGLHESGPEGGLADDLDPLEPDGSPGAEVEVRGARFERYLGAGDIDRFRFYAERSGLFLIEVQTDLDVQLLLYREGERIPFEVRGNPGLQVIRLQTHLAPGYFIAELLAFDPELQGPYTIGFGAAPAADLFEPDDTPAEAKPLSPGSRQERGLSPGNPDWVELRPDRPGFYTLYTAGLMVDSTLALFREGRVQLMADAGDGPNAHLGFFLGPGRWFARVGGKPPLDEGPYSLSFERLQPEQLVPGGGVREFTLRAAPVFLQLRILQAGRYQLRWQGSRGPVAAELFSLPALKSLETSGPLALASGDYLLALRSAETQTVKLCVAAEAEAEACRKGF